MSATSGLWEASSSNNYTYVFCGPNPLSKTLRLGRIELLILAEIKRTVLQIVIGSETRDIDEWPCLGDLDAEMRRAAVAIARHYGDLAVGVAEAQRALLGFVLR